MGSASASQAGESAVIGRRRELERLDELLGHAAAGRPRVVVLRGDAGIGKSHLLRALTARARTLGFACGIGHGQERMPVPYLAFGDALLALGQRESHVDARRPWQQLRGLARSAGGRAVDAAPADDTRAETLLQVAASVVELGRIAPTLLVIDDLHWADDESVALLLQVGFALADAAADGGARVALAIGTRPLDPDSARARTLMRLIREPICGVLDLRGLDLLDTTEMLAAASPGRPSPGVVQVVHEGTGGNPLFIRGVLARARRDGVDPAAAFDPAAGPLPEDLSAVVRAQVAGTEPAALRLLRRAAILGARFSLSLLAHLTERSLEDLLDDLARTPELCRLDGEQGEFAHPLIRQELLRGMPSALRSELHAAAVASLEAQPEPDPVELAHHVQSAGDHVPAARRLQVFETAGARLEAMHAVGKAARFFAAAAELSPQPAHRAELHHRAGACFQRHYDREPALEQFTLAEQGFEAVGDVASAARVLVNRARIELYSVALGKLRDLSQLERALSRLPPEETEVAGWIECALADAYFYAQRPEQGQSHARRSLGLGEEEGDHRLCRFACLPLGLSHAQSMEYEEAARTFGRAFEHGRATGDTRLELAPRVRRAPVLQTLGRLDEAARDLEQAIDVAQRCEPFEHAFALAHLCSIETARGRFDRVEELGADLLRRLPRLDGRPWAPLAGLPALAAGRHAAGEVDGALRALRALREPGRYVEKVGGAEHITGMVLEDWIAADQGAPKDDDAADGRRARVERYAGRIDLKTADGMGLSVAAALTELCVHYQLPWACEGTRRVLFHALEHGAVLTSPWPLSIPRVLANAEAAFGDAERAHGLYGHALRSSEASGARPEAARARLDYARWLVSTGGEADGRRASELLVPALDALGELGMATLLAPARNLAAALGLQPPPTPRPPRVQRRDLALVHELMTADAHAEVGERLLLGTDGLRERAGSVLDRLGVRGTLEAAPYVFEHGLVGAHPPQPGLPLVLLVTDVVGFTPMVERLGDAEAQRVMRAHNRMLRGQVRDHGGLEITHTGDEIVASFRSVPEAVACAVALQEELARRNAAGDGPPLSIRIGVHAGEPLLEEGRLFGVAVIAAVRICSACEPDRILVSEVVRESARGVTFRFVSRGAQQLKGIAEPMALHEVLWGDASTTPPATPHETPRTTQV